jgi:hypothetical protein
VQASGFETAGLLLARLAAAHIPAVHPNLLQHVTHVAAQHWQRRGIVLPLYALTDSPCLTLLATT